MPATGRTFGTVWTFRTKRFRVALVLEQDRGYQYDGDDPDGETQERLDSGEFVAFDSRVIVELDGEEIGSDSLCGSVYDSDRVSEFFTDHRTSSAEYRNTLEQKAARRVICHYFPGMVREAIGMAREHVRAMTVPPYIRENA